MIKKQINEKLIQSRFYPNPYYIRNPFKMYEYLHVVRLLGLQSNDKLLDVGCGGGLQTTLFAKRCASATGIDISLNDINRAKSEQHLVCERMTTDFICTKIEEAGFEDASFSKVVSVCVLEHIPDYEQAMQEVFRVLIPGGACVWSVDSLETIENKDIINQHRVRYDVACYFKVNSLQALMQNTGFRNIIVYPILTSRFARDLFVKGIQNEYAYRYSQALGLFLLLWIYEQFSRYSKKGIYLIARGIK